jgi:hypothetical protein
MFDSHMPCRSAKGLYFVFPVLFTQCGHVWFKHVMPFPCHATIMPFWKRPLKATAQRGMGTTCVWISIGSPERTCGRPSYVRLFPATTRSSTKVVTRSRLVVRIFPSTTRTFTKDKALSENGRVAAWHVWINAAGERHGMCELALICFFPPHSKLERTLSHPLPSSSQLLTSSPRMSGHVREDLSGRLRLCNSA